jgi:endonuclease YncB( thermonuclease family)
LAISTGSPNGPIPATFWRIDLALAALTNGAARLAIDATPQYQKAAEEARRHHRGIFQ